MSHFAFSKLPFASVGSKLFVALLALGCAAHAERVFAHAGPQVRGVFPRNGEHPEVLLSNRGLIFGSGGAGAKDWALMCNEALGVGTAEAPELAVFDDGQIMANTTNGLLMTSDGGCNWVGVEPFSKVSTPGLAQHPTDKSRVYVATYGPGAGGVSVTPDAGKTWQQLLMVEDNDYLRFVRIAPSDPNRVYVRSLRFGDDGNFVYSVFRSDNGGQKWERLPDIPLTGNESDFALLGVHPKNPDLLIAMAETVDPLAMPERLMISRDGGKTFENTLMTSVIGSIDWSADAHTLYVSSDTGLFVSTDDAKTFNRVGTAEYLSCVVVRDDVILVCGYYKGIPGGTPGIGISTNGGESFEHYMHLNEVAMPLACAAQTSTGKACALPWTDWQIELLGGLPTAGAPATAGTSALAAGSTAPGGASGGPSAGSNVLDAGPPPGSSAGPQPSAGTAGSTLDAGMKPAAGSSKSSACSFQRQGAASLPHSAAFGLGLGLLLVRRRLRKR